MKKILIVSIVFFFALPLVSAEKMPIAVVDFSSNNVSKYLARAVSENINTEFAKKTEYFKVIERSKIKSVVAEQGLQMTGITDSRSAVKMGKLLSAKKILVGTVSKVGKVFTMTVRVIDVETGEVNFAESERCTKEDDVDDASRYLALKLINRITGENFKLPKRDYSREEGRNKFAIGISYQASINISKGYYPSLLFPANEGDPFKVGLLPTDKIKNLGQSISLIISYEFVSFFTLRMDFSFIIDGPEHYEERDKPYASSNLYFVNGFVINKAGKIDVFGQINLKFDGFMPFVALGIGYQFYLKEGGGTGSSQSIQAGNSDSYKIDMINGNIMNLTSEIGCAIYLSKYVEFIFTIGFVIPVIYDVFKKVTLTENDGGTLTLSSWEDLDSKLNLSGMKGVLPIQMYLKVGFLFRLF